MAIKVYKRNNAGRRNMSVVKAESVSYAKQPEKSLMAPMKSRAGRSHGKISVRHQGGGHKQRYRIIDFKQNKYDIPGRIAAIERDPMRSAFIALINYRDGEKKYIVASEGMEAGMDIMCSPTAPIKLGNRTQVKSIPTGTVISASNYFQTKERKLCAALDQKRF